MIRFFKDFVLGIGSCIEAVRIVFQRKLWIYFIVLALFSSLIVYGAFLLSQNLEVCDVCDYKDDDPQEYLLASFKLFINLLLAFLGLRLNKYFVLVLLPPMLARISERTEYFLTGNKYKFVWRLFIQDVVRGVKIALRNLLWEAGILLTWLALTLLLKVTFGINTPEWLTWVFGFVIGWYFYGYSMMDYTNERRRLDISDSTRFIRKHMGLTLAIGAVYSSMFLLNIDFSWFFDDNWLKHININLGVVFAPVICVVAATVGIHDLVDLSKNEFASSTNDVIEPTAE